MADLSIAKLARIADVSVVMVRNYEREASMPSDRDLTTIRSALEGIGVLCSVDEDGIETVSIDWRIADRSP